MIRRLIITTVSVSVLACPMQIGDRCGEGLPPCPLQSVCVAELCVHVESDAGSEADAGVGDAGRPPNCDGGCPPFVDAGNGGGADAGVDAGLDAGMDAGLDAGGMDAGLDAGMDAGLDAGMDAGLDAGMDAGLDAGPSMHLGAILESWVIPANSVQSNQFGFDLNGDGGVDNRLASFFVALPFGNDFRDHLATNTDIGGLIALQDIEYRPGGAATVRLYRGANPMPPACD